LSSSALSSVFICKLANLTTRGFAFDLGMMAKGVELGPITSPNLLIVTPLNFDGGSLGTIDDVGLFGGPTCDCLVSCPTSIGMVGTCFLGCELMELDLRRALGAGLSASKLTFVAKFSFSNTGLSSDPMPDLATRPQHEQRL